jgi:hypothetical protein
MHAECGIRDLASDHALLVRQSKKNAWAADIAGCYHLNPFELTPGQRAALYANIPRVMAQRQILERRFEGMGHEAIYNLWMVAYGDERLATDMRTKFLESLVEQTCNAANNQR